MSLIQDILQKLDKMTFIFYAKSPGDKKPSLPKTSDEYYDELKRIVTDTKEKTFTVLYNPTTFNQKFAVKYCPKRNTGGGSNDQEFKSMLPQDLTVELLFDSTKISAQNLFSDGVKNVLNNKGVDTLVNTFVSTGMGWNTEEHRPPFCQVIWGTFLFEGVIKNIDVSYLLFNRQGRPIRAKVTVSLVSQLDNILSPEIKDAHSPDLTKVYTARAGDTLPLIALREYDREDLYLELARVNKLKNYRKLQPGQTIVLPPIKKLEV